MNLLVVTREQGRRRLDEVGRIGAQAAGGEAKHAAAGELERGRKPGVDLEVRVGVQRHASIGAGDGGGEMELGFGARRLTAADDSSEQEEQSPHDRWSPPAHSANSSWIR